MDEQVTQQLSAAAERMANASETLDRVVGRLEAQYEALTLKVDRIVAAIEEADDAEEAQGVQASVRTLQERVAELEKANEELKAQQTRQARKTLPPVVTMLIGKNDLEAGGPVDTAAIERSLQVLSVEQRIAVKAEMARAGILE